MKGAQKVVTGGIGSAALGAGALMACKLFYPNDRPVIYQKTTRTQDAAGNTKEVQESKIGFENANTNTTNTKNRPNDACSVHEEKVSSDSSDDILLDAIDLFQNDYIFSLIVKLTILLGIGLFFYLLLFRNLFGYLKEKFNHFYLLVAFFFFQLIMVFSAGIVNGIYIILRYFTIL